MTDLEPQIVAIDIDRRGWYILCMIGYPLAKPPFSLAGVPLWHLHL